MKDEKLQKALARLGLGSRRQMEEVIRGGRVSINGKIATIGDRVEQGDEIRVDGRLLRYTAENDKRRRVLMYYKPEGEVCSTQDREGRPTVFERLPPLTNDRWVMVGRLDINSTGLLLFTNDGELAHRLMHPSNEIEREYAVRVMGEVTPEMLKNLTTGVMLEDGMAQFDNIVERGGEGINKWYQVRLKEGRNREVRRLFESQGLKVSRLLRTRYGSVNLPRELRTGRFLELDKNEIHALTDLVNLRPRQGTGLYGIAKRRQERREQNPLKARRVPNRSGNSTKSESGRGEERKSNKPFERNSERGSDRNSDKNSGRNGRNNERSSSNPRHSEQRQERGRDDRNDNRRSRKAD